MTEQKTEQKPADHKAIRDAVEEGPYYTAMVAKPDLRALLADLDEARAALTAAKAGGWVAVPVEPTPEMIENGTLCVGQTSAITRSIYAAMLAARPIPNPPKEQ